MNERIADRIPKALVVIKKGKQSHRDITVYDFIACYYGLRPLHGDIYLDFCGNQFIRTKYGFQPAIRENIVKKLEDSETKRRKSNHRFEREMAKMKELAKQENRLLKDRVNELTQHLAEARRALRLVGNTSAQSLASLNLKD
ncbi:MAG: hypothetical protein JSS79_18795 [Bacteroidetes bacterium]|nr:hypothetical protein [Bacteroidota bacterium]